MKLSDLVTAGSLAIAVIVAGPAVAQTTTRTTTTVTKVHGPLHVLPHHNRKICRTRYYHRRRMTKCYYH